MTAMGEGSSNQGDVHEALNFAAIHKLPFVFLVENNGYAISVPASREVSVPDVAMRASGYGIPGVVVDGADVLACYAAARTAVERARAGEGPTLIEAKVTRLTGHSSDDQQTKYRSAEELAEEKERDALPHFRDQLRAAGVLTEAIEAALADELDGDRRGRHRLRRGRARPRPVHRDALGATPRTGRPRRRRPWGLGPGGRARGRRLMALMTFIEAIRDTLAEEMRRDEQRHRARRGRRQEGRRLPRHRRAVGGVRRRPGDRHAAHRVDDRRRVDRRRRQRPAPGRRDPVRRLHPPGVQPDRVRGGPDALPLEQRRRRADDDPGAVRRRRPRRALPLAVGRGVLHPRAGPQGRRPVDAARRPRPAAQLDPRRRPGPLLRAQEDVPLGPRRRPRRRLRRPARPGQGHPSRVAGHGHRLRADGPLRARGGRPGGRGGDQRRGGRPADAPAARQGHGPRARSARPASA